jgi:hypothetical protein
MIRPPLRTGFWIDALTMHCSEWRHRVTGGRVCEIPMLLIGIAIGAPRAGSLSLGRWTG